MKISIIIALLALGGCEADSDNAETSDGATTNQVAVDDAAQAEALDGDPADYDGSTLSVEVVQTGQIALSSETSLQLTSEGASFGQADGDDLESLKYFFIRIMICEGITVSDTGYSNPENCLDVYNAGDDIPDYETFSYADASSYVDQYTDLLDADSLSELSTNFILEDHHVREYNYGIVEWFRPVMLTAKVPLNDGETTLYTKSGRQQQVQLGDATQDATVVDQITTGPAESTTVELPNGGAWFKFASPLVITEEDLTNKTKFKLSLTFNPDGVVQGRDALVGAIRGVADTYPTTGEPTSGYGISVPLLAITPVAHRLDDPLRYEFYRFTHESSPPFDVRLQLYYLTSDEDKSIVGVEGQSLVRSDSTSGPPGMSQVFSVGKENDEVLLKDWQGNAIFTNFQRLSDGDPAGTAVFNSIQSYTVSYELESDAAVP